MLLNAQKAHQRSTGQRPPVPQGDDAVGEPGVLVALAELTGEAKVGQLEAALIVDEQVGCLEVTVQHALVVAVRQALQELLHVALDLQATATMWSPSA